jgi:hypothetical protein
VIAGAKLSTLIGKDLAEREARAAHRRSTWQGGVAKLPDMEAVGFGTDGRDHPSTLAFNVPSRDPDQRPPARRHPSHGFGFQRTDSSVRSYQLPFDDIESLAHAPVQLANALAHGAKQAPHILQHRLLITHRSPQV